MAYGSLPKREPWLAMTVRPRRDSVAVLGGRLALVRLRLLVLIGSMINRFRECHARSMGAAPEAVLSLLPEFTMVDNAMHQAKCAGKNRIYRIEGQ